MQDAAEFQEIESYLSVNRVLQVMDQTDRRILDFLEEDGRASFTEIAGEVGVSEGTVRNRVERMREEGVIQKFTVETGGEASVQAFLMAEVATDVSFPELVDEFPDGLEVYEVAGDQDLVVKIEADSSEEVNQVVDSIRMQEGVSDTQTYMVLSRRR